MKQSIAAADANAAKHARFSESARKILGVSA